MSLADFFRSKNKSHPDECMDRWDNPNFSKTERKAANEPVEEILARAVPHGNDAAYERDTRSLGWKALYYIQEKDDPVKAQECLNHLEKFLPVAPAFAVREYGNIFFHGVVRAGKDSDVGQASKNMAERAVGFFLEAAHYDQAHYALKTEAELYSAEDCKHLFSEQDREKLKSLAETLPDGSAFTIGPGKEQVTANKVRPNKI